ncbi:hypothetical protein V1282_001631 [Nitrobacteraceae bacterium AZCC 2146]
MSQVICGSSAVASAARRRLPDASCEEVYEADPPSRSAQAFVMPVLVPGGARPLHFGPFACQLGILPSPAEGPGRDAAPIPVARSILYAPKGRCRHMAQRLLPITQVNDDCRPEDCRSSNSLGMRTYRDVTSRAAVPHAMRFRRFACLLTPLSFRGSSSFNRPSFNPRTHCAINSWLRPCGDLAWAQEISHHRKNGA